METESTFMEATLCYPIRGDEILLARKTKNIGKGKLNGFGGGIEKGEAHTASCVRELKEESGLVADPQDLRKQAVIYFHNVLKDKGIFTCKVHVYIVENWTGEPRESDEMVDPKWYPIANLPWGEMMVGDSVWLPHILKGKKIIAHVPYGPNQETLTGEVLINETIIFRED